VPERQSCAAIHARQASEITPSAKPVRCSVCDRARRTPSASPTAISFIGDFRTPGSVQRRCHPPPASENLHIGRRARCSGGVIRHRHPKIYTLADFALTSRNTADRRHKGANHSHCRHGSRRNHAALRVQGIRPLSWPQWGFCSRLEGSHAALRPTARMSSSRSSTTR
jgi:hypothetical protein